MTQVSIVNVDIEVKKPGARGWSMATVTYVQNGETKRQNVVSFSNPQVFKDVQKYIGEDVDVEIGQNDKGYPEWKRIVGGGVAASPVAGAGTQAPPAAATRVAGSNYETREERARRQVLIVRQSSLSNALDYYKITNGTSVTSEEVRELAQEFADWVFAQDDAEEADGPSA